MKAIGNAVVGQSGGPTSAINATLAGVIAGCLEFGIEKIYGMKNGVEGLEKEDLLLLNDYFEKDRSQLDLLSATPAAALGSCRKKITEDEQMARLYEVFEKYDITYFFYIGGNDSMDAVAKLTDYASRNEGLRKMFFIGVPKTIDNDLYLTDHTPGYGSAAKYVACTMQEIMRDCAVYTKKAVTIVEIMGRDAGWLTASAALTQHICGIGPKFIYLPEVAFDEEQFLADIKAALENDPEPYLVIAVSEGIRDKNKKYVAEAAMSGAVDSFGHKYLAGTGKYLENLVRDKIGCKVRSVELNILQRCASHIASKTDIEESKKIGAAAVRHALSGESGKMMSFRRVKKAKQYSVEIFAEDVLEIANKIKKIPKSYINDAGNNVNEKCVEYMLPLIKGEQTVIYEDGIPVHFSF